MQRVREKTTPAQLEGNRFETYKWGMYPCSWTRNGYTYTSMMPGPHVLASVETSPIAKTSAPLFDSYEKIVDEKGGTQNRLKPVYHVKSEIKYVPWLYGAQENTQDREYTYADANSTAPQQWYAKRKLGSHEPAAVALTQMGARGFIRLSGGNPVYKAGVDFVLSDRYAELPARLVKKLDSLHLANIAWEAREAPQLAEMFQKRNRLATKAGLDWIMGSYAGGRMRPWTMLKACGPNGYASKAFLQWLSHNQLGYSFGLAPTVGDVLSIAHSLRKGLKPKTFRTTATIRQSKEYHQTVSLEGVGLQVKRAQCTDHCTVSRVDGVRATLRRPRYYSDIFNRIIPALLGHNPANMIWRAIPFSWCVDLVLSIDDVLDTVWCQSQTEYELEYWSSVKGLSTQSFGFDVRKDYAGPYPARPEELIGSDGVMEKVVSVYNRFNREPPTWKQSVRASLSPTMGYLTALVALGFIPSMKKR